jgi:hypothetical protein
MDLWSMLLLSLPWGTKTTYESFAIYGHFWVLFDPLIRQIPGGKRLKATRR